jgi:hypothetical protein
VDIGHCSMKFSDKPKEIEHDAEFLFNRNLEILTGTEAGAGNPLGPILKRVGNAHGYKFVLDGGDSWVAVHKEFIQGKKWDHHYKNVISHDEGVGRHSNKGLQRVTWDTPDVGQFSQAVSHFLTRGRKPGEPNWKFNQRFGPILQEYGTEYGKGNRIALFNADTNIVDKFNDVTFGADFRTSGDSLNKHEGTGHGNIDVTSVWDHDGRFEWVDIDVFTDKEVFLNTDHYYLETRAHVQYLSGRGGIR